MGVNYICMKVLRVFANENGLYGNPVGIIVDVHSEVSKAERQKIASVSGFSEIVFINDSVTRNISIYSPKKRNSICGSCCRGSIFLFKSRTTSSCDRGFWSWRQNRYLAGKRINLG